MENNTNILSPLVDSLFEAGKLIYRMITKDNSFDFNSYFDTVKLYTEKGNEKKEKRHSVQAYRNDV